jgi:hypothetical protein
MVCPKCGSKSLRFSHLRSASERIRSLFGIRPIRCRDCRTRFPERLWKLSELRYARCPKCLRMNLVFWSENHYRIRLSQNIFLFFGAKRYRCDACRYNFVSFRHRKFGNSRRKREKAFLAAVAIDTASGSGITKDGEEGNGSK